MNSKSARIIIIGGLIAVAVGVGTYLVSTTGSGQQELVMVATKESSAEQNILVDWVHIHGIVIDPSDPTSIYLGTHVGLYKSSGGSGWKNIGEDRSDLRGFIVHPYDTKVMYSSGHPPEGQNLNLGFRKSTDGGLTWETVSTILDPPVDFHAMTISPANPNILYGYDSAGRGLFITKDAGNSWKQINSPHGAVISLAAHPKDEKVVFAGTHSGIYRSDDEGLTWTQLDEFKGFGVTALAFERDGALYAFATFPPMIKGIDMAKSNDDGKTWNMLRADLGNEVVFHIAVDPTNQNILYASTALRLQSGEEPESLYRSTDGGQSWLLLTTSSKSHPAIGSESSKRPITLADVSMTDINGRTFSFGQFASKVLVLHLTAPNCPSCAAQNFALTELARKYTPDEVSFVSVNIDPTLKDADLKEWAKRYGITWTVARDSVGLALDLGIKTSSTVFVIDQTRTSVFRHDSVTDAATLMEEIEQLIG